VPALGAAADGSNAKENAINETLINLWSQTATQRDALAEKLQGRTDELATVREVLQLVQEIQTPAAAAPAPEAKSPVDLKHSVEYLESKHFKSAGHAVSIYYRGRREGAHHSLLVRRIVLGKPVARVDDFEPTIGVR